MKFEVLPVPQEFDGQKMFPWIVVVSIHNSFNNEDPFLLYFFYSWQH